MKISKQVSFINVSSLLRYKVFTREVRTENCHRLLLLCLFLTLVFSDWRLFINLVDTVILFYSTLTSYTFNNCYVFIPFSVRYCHLPYSFDVHVTLLTLLNFYSRVQGIIFLQVLHDTRECRFDFTKPPEIFLDNVGRPSDTLTTHFIRKLPRSFISSRMTPPFPRCGSLLHSISSWWFPN